MSHASVYVFTFVIFVWFRGSLFYLEDCGVFVVIRDGFVSVPFRVGIFAVLSRQELGVVRVWRCFLPLLGELVLAFLWFVENMKLMV